MDSLKVSRITISVVVFLYSVYHAWLGLSSLYAYSMPVTAVLMIGGYLVLSLASITFYRGFNIPSWLAFLNFGFTALTPFVFSLIIVRNEPASYATWYVVGLATLMGITAFRGHVVIAWLGFVAIAIQVVTWGGVSTLLNAGVVGAMLMTFAGHAAGYAVSTANRQALESIEEQKRLEVGAATRSTARKVRQERIQQTLRQAQPLLSEIVQKDGKLDPQMAAEARLLEAGLRDLIRGRGLLNEKVSEAAQRARARGVKVEILDEGGLDGSSEDERTVILEKIVSAIDGINDGKITVRSPQGEKWKVTIAGMSPSRDEPSIWQKI